MDKVYHVIYTAAALKNMKGKYDHISLTLHSPDLAETWSLRLATEIEEDLKRFPYKYPLYHVEKWRAEGLRQFTFRNDVIFYSVNEEEHAVYIHAIYTKGQNLLAHLDENM